MDWPGGIMGLTGGSEVGSANSKITWLPRRDSYALCPWGVSWRWLDLEESEESE
jgi:hypothetical protein